MTESPITDHRQEEMHPKSSENAAAAAETKLLRPHPEHAPKCPRCDSENTKFCYYNNYSLSQPRYFCKSCRRYWTKGGTLRNVPIGGGCRKNKRSSSKRSSLDRIDLLLQSQIENNQNLLITNNAVVLPNSSSSSKSCESLSVAFARLQKQCDIGFGFGFDHHQSFVQAPIFANPVMTAMTSSSNFNTQIGSLYNNNGLFENVGDENYVHTHTHTQPLLMGYEDQLSCLDLMSSGGGSVKQDTLCDHDSDVSGTILREFPWQMGIDNNGAGGCLSSLENDYMNFNNNNNNNNSNNLVLGSNVGNESAPETSWPTLINTSVLM